MKVRSWAGVGFAGAMAILACSGSSTTISSSACEHLYNALQTYYAKCGITVGIPMGAQRDRGIKSCEQIASVMGSTTTSGDIDSCASALEGVPCNSEKALEALTSCTKPGTLANGAACGSSIQCTSGRCTNTSTMCGVCQATAKEGEACSQGMYCITSLVCSGTTGTCLKPVYGAAGAACDTFAQRCGDNLRCDYTAKKCVAYATAGAACASTTECAAPLVCTAMKCADPPGAGGDCSMNNRCAKDLVCDYNGTKTCTTLTYAKAGQPCSSANVCESSLSCPQSKVCPMVIADGAACNPADTMATCDYAAQCVNGVCTLGPLMCK
jgi:hypothetical protein